MSKLRATRYQLLAYLYFFFNSVGLAGGLLYTNILSPLIYFWILKKTKKPILLPLFFVLIPYDLIHLILGVELKSFIVSNLLIVSTYIFVVGFYYFIERYHELEEIFKRILIANFCFTLIACIIYFTPFREVLWYKNKFTQSVEGFHRLALLTFEASYYSLLFAPIAIYYLAKIFFRINTKPANGTLILVLVPLFLSLSMGVLGAILIAFLAIYIIHWQKVFYKRNFFNYLIIFLVVLFFTATIILIFFPNNVLLIRINNILSGIDTSTRGRTNESYKLAWMVAKEKSIWFGSGLGQVKELAYDVVKRYLNYWGELEVVRIPNAVAETMAIFGIFGIAIRFSLIFYFFIKTKVLENYYRTLLFVFVFVYQFTGSYITNIVEYVIWVIAFSTVFKQFDVKQTNTNQVSTQKPSE